MSNSLNQITKFQRELGEKGWQAAEERAGRKSGAADPGQSAGAH